VRKVAGAWADQSPPFSAEVKNACSCTSSPAYDFTASTRKTLTFLSVFVFTESLNGSYFQRNKNNLLSFLLVCLFKWLYSKKVKLMWLTALFIYLFKIKIFHPIFYRVSAVEKAIECSSMQQLHNEGCWNKTVHLVSLKGSLCKI